MRADEANRDLLKTMKRAGCDLVSIGGESGDPDILESCGKNTKTWDITYSVIMLKEAGIKSLVYFMFGLPGENKRTVNATIEFAKRIEPDYVEFFPATPFPGTDFYKWAKEKKMLTSTNTDDYVCGGGNFVVKIHGVKTKGLIKKAYRSFYFRPSYVLKLKPREIMMGFRFVWGYICSIFSM